MTILCKKRRNIRSWMCLILAMVLLLGQFPVGVTAIQSEEFSITGIQRGVYRPANNDWYIILDTDIADFALTSISGLKAPVDDTTAQVWFQINSQVGVSAGSFSFTIAAISWALPSACPSATITMPDVLFFLLS